MRKSAWKGEMLTCYSTGKWLVTINQSGQTSLTSTNPHTEERSENPLLKLALPQRLTHKGATRAQDF